MQALVTGPHDARHTVILAHGAGQPMDHEAMNALADGLNNTGVRVARFEFPYMHRRRVNGRGGAPDRQPVLEQTWRDVIERVRTATGSDVAIRGGATGRESTAGRAPAATCGLAGAPGAGASPAWWPTSAPRRH